VTIRFKIVAAPESSDDSKRFEDGTTGEYDDTPMADNDDQPKDTTTFPLARFFTPPPSTTNLEIRLDFQRAGAGKGPCR